jgi:hemoglobin
MNTQQSPKSYDQLGGQPAVDAAVDIFTVVLADGRISRFFDDVEDKQISKQKAFLTMVFGGPANTPGKTCAGHSPCGQGHRRFPC